ncbi:hypothetical protein M9Y10_012350 [Tritrichomonas musculus]|uniref:Protein kinase domain-containing protein n=1 Tax=Tritrichomonas musculus TaxID=1915356 RepID=A0ABR2IEN7_9EUKA
MSYLQCERFFYNDANMIGIYNSELEDQTKEHECYIFCNQNDSSYIIKYKKLTPDERNFLECNNIKTYSYFLPISKLGSLNHFFNESNDSFNKFKANLNYDFYCKKWIYQIVNAVYYIHCTLQTYHGNLSDFCIFLDENLDAKIGYIGFPIKESTDSLKAPNYYYIEPRRVKVINKKKISIQNLIEQENNSVESFRQYDMFSLGLLLELILTSKKNVKFGEKFTENLEKLSNFSRYSDYEKNNNDNDNNNIGNNSVDNHNNDNHNFKQRIINEIINPCLRQEGRPSIDEIKGKLDQILSNDEFYPANNTTIHDILADKNDLSKFERDNSKSIAQKIKSQRNLISFFHTNDNNENQQNLLKLHDNFIFQFFFQDNCFFTKPILLKEEDLDISQDTFESQLKDKIENEIYQEYFFKNVYLCSLEEFLKIHSPSYNEIHYWMIYLINYLMLLHSEDPSDHFPPNFSSETIFVSAINYNECNSVSEFKGKPVQFQLSVFPFNSKETHFSRLYHAKIVYNDVMSDIFALGVLMLELLLNASGEKKYFELKLRDKDKDKMRDDDYYNILSEAKEKLVLPDDQKFYKQILDACLDNKADEDNFFEVYEMLSLKGRNYDSMNEEDMEITSDSEPTLLLNNFVTCHQTMNFERFVNLFDIYNQLKKEEEILFKQTLNRLCQNFFKKDYDYDIYEVTYFLDLVNILYKHKSMLK